MRVVPLFETLIALDKSATIHNTDAPASATSNPEAPLFIILIISP
jgi:hypothetical protein